MNPDAQMMVSISEANKDFSRVMHMADLHGRVVILKDSVSPKKYERIRFASERDSLPGIHQRCPSCGALPGYFHHWDCDAERCPVCREAPLFCICEESYIEICDIPTEERGGKNE